MELNVKKGDTIKVLSGERAGLTGKVTSGIKRVGRGMNYTLYVETTIGKVSLNNLEVLKWLN